MEEGHSSAHKHVHECAMLPAWAAEAVIPTADLVNLVASRLRKLQEDPNSSTHKYTMLQGELGDAMDKANQLHSTFMEELSQQMRNHCHHIPDVMLKVWQSHMHLTQIVATEHRTLAKANAQLKTQLVASSKKIRDLLGERHRAQLHMNEQAQQLTSTRLELREARRRLNDLQKDYARLEQQLSRKIDEELDMSGEDSDSSFSSGEILPYDVGNSVEDRLSALRGATNRVESHVIDRTRGGGARLLVRTLTNPAMEVGTRAGTRVSKMPDPVDTKLLKPKSLAGTSDGFDLLLNRMETESLLQLELSQQIGSLFNQIHYNYWQMHRSSFLDATGWARANAIKVTVAVQTDRILVAKDKRDKPKEAWIKADREAPPPNWDPRGAWLPSGLRPFVIEFIDEPKPWPKKKLARAMIGMLIEKMMADSIMLVNGKPVIEMARFISEEYYSTKYGLRKLVDQQIQELVVSVRTMRQAAKPHKPKGKKLPPEEQMLMASASSPPYGGHESIIGPILPWMDIRVRLFGHSFGAFPEEPMMPLQILTFGLQLMHKIMKNSQSMPSVDTILQDADGQIDLARSDTVSVLQTEWTKVHLPSVNSICDRVLALPPPAVSKNKACVDFDLVLSIVLDGKAKENERWENAVTSAFMTAAEPLEPPKPKARQGAGRPDSQPATGGGDAPAPAPAPSTGDEFKDGAPEEQQSWMAAKVLTIMTFTQAVRQLETGLASSEVLQLFRIAFEMEVQTEWRRAVFEETGVLFFFHRPTHATSWKSPLKKQVPPPVNDPKQLELLPNAKAAEESDEELEEILGQSKTAASELYGDLAFITMSSFRAVCDKYDIGRIIIKEPLPFSQLRPSTPGSSSSRPTTPGRPASGKPDIAKAQKRQKARDDTFDSTTSSMAADRNRRLNDVKRVQRTAEQTQQ